MPFRAAVAASNQAEPRRDFRIERVDAGSGVVDLQCAGTFRLADGGPLWTELKSAVEGLAQGEVRIDLAKVDTIDGGAMALLVQTRWDLETKGMQCSFVGANEGVQKLVHLYHGDIPAKPEPEPPHPGFLERVGQVTWEALIEVQLVLAFLGSLVLEIGGVIRTPRTANWREIPPLMNRTGADAVPIVLLINFLLGLVLGFQAAVQLKQFGANIFVADLVGLSVTRELGPLMTAIIVCGRSGAAFAAELGTMKVSEEVDALRTMGFGPLRFLVLPRMLSLFFVIPILTLLGDFIGMLGGLLVGITTLDLTVRGYLTETIKTIRIWDVMQGLVKCGVFGVAIGLIACQQGLSTSGGAEGVGRRTTSAVVLTLFTLILVDAGFTVVFHMLNL